MDIVDRLLNDQPSFHGGGTVRWDSLPETLKMIGRSVRVGDRTAEIGCGASTVVFTARGAHHTAISPDVREHERIREYCHSIGVDDQRLTFIEGLSEDVLPTFCRERVLDVEFIDGAHSFPYPEVDWHYLTKSLKVGGMLVIDDIPIPAVVPIFRHMRLDPRWRFEGIFDSRAAAFRLLNQPQSEDDWVAQPYNAGYPDYSFEPFHRRSRLIAAHTAGRMRARVANRYPRLRAFWKAFSRSDTGRE
jgi:hypothetical protein